MGPNGAEADGVGDPHELLPREHDADAHEQPSSGQEDGQSPEHGGLDLHARAGQRPDHEMQLEYDEEDEESFALVSQCKEKRQGSPQSSTGYQPRQSPASVAPTEVSVVSQNRHEAKVGDVHGLIYGEKKPSCHCGLMGRLHLAQTEGPNFDRTFYRCPRPIGHQCRFFMWTTQQPFHDVTSWKYQDQGQGRTPPAEALQLMVQEKCTHPKKTRQGTNGSEDCETCKICRKILKQEPKITYKAKGKSGTTSTASAEEMAEFHKFLAWRRENEK